MTALDAATVAACAVAVVLSGVRWLRVAQREHYLAGSVSRFALRWWRSSPTNVAAGTVAVAAAVAAARVPPVALATGAVVAAGPWGLGLRGRTSKLAWTRRLRTLAVVSAVLAVVPVAVALVAGGGAVRAAVVTAAVVALAVPVLVDLACGLLAPVEARLAAAFVDRAAGRLAEVAPDIVAITGSFGKTSTKHHLAHLLGSSRAVVATPASFNNRAGLARAVNEHLVEGTEVFVAEMGTYGPGEIADLCRWCPPLVAVLTAIGPVHLERFGTEDRIVEAKAEITRGARDVVLNADDPRLAALADRLDAAGVHVVRCSAADPAADVAVVPGAAPGTVDVSLAGAPLVSSVAVAAGVRPTNLACAVGAALAVGADKDALAKAVADLPAVDHRLVVARGAAGFAVLDDTYNANPAGARAALGALAALDADRRVVVTPGMVELGRRQAAANRELGAAATTVADELVVVGRTNRRALVGGAADAGRSGAVTTVRHRADAVELVRRRLGPDGAVLYENDLPDHYP